MVGEPLDGAAFERRPREAGEEDVVHFGIAHDAVRKGARANLQENAAVD